MNIYVGNLDFKVKESELESIFSEFGTVESIKIIIDKISGRSKGFAFIEMSDDDAANKAIKTLHGSSVGNRALIVNEAKPKKTDY